MTAGSLDPLVNILAHTQFGSIPLFAPCSRAQTAWKWWFKFDARKQIPGIKLRPWYRPLSAEGLAPSGEAPAAATTPREPEKPGPECEDARVRVLLEGANQARERPILTVNLALGRQRERRYQEYCQWEYRQQECHNNSANTPYPVSYSLRLNGVIKPILASALG
ncbi:hypothetical protein BD779DRAFT_1477422 [Infundibulicybe gibba]|nr:hypothetical protein BD779DRAFT_1477422 [Infundibulicybe gibba]